MKKLGRRSTQESKKLMLGLCLSVLALTIAISGCGNETNYDNGQEPGGNGNPQGFDPSTEIAVVSREDGSGTRGAFVELVGVLQADSQGTKVDRTTVEAIIAKSTSVAMTTVSNNEYAIGYISLGSLNDTVKALKIDGAEATAAKVQSGDYKIARPFNIATKGDISDLAKDFIDYIMSSDGQAIVQSAGYIPVAGDKAYDGSKPSGKVVIEGSSSVTPVMEKLKEAYLKVNTNASIEVQETDSSAGMNATVDGLCDIGMASRALKASELDKGLSATVIAIDGIAIVVNTANPVDEMSSEQVRDIFTGEITSWADVASK